MLASRSLSFCVPVKSVVARVLQLKAAYRDFLLGNHHCSVLSADSNGGVPRACDSFECIFCKTPRD